MNTKPSLVEARLCVASYELLRTATGYEVKDQRDHSEDKQDMNQEPGSMEGEETTCPKNNQNESNNQPHMEPPYQRDRHNSNR
jgi:hypothetical protein